VNQVKKALSQETEMLSPQERLHALLQGSEEYKGDRGKAALLLEYVEVQKLFPECTLSEFLQRKQQAMKHAQAVGEPLQAKDVLAELCPRTKKSAESAGVEQWTAKEVAGLLEFYAETCDTAKRISEPIPPLRTFVDMLGPLYKQGEFQPSASEPQVEEVATVKRTEQVFGGAGRPTAEGQQVAVTISPAGRQMKGTVSRIYHDDELDKDYGDFVSDDGEEISGLSLDKFQLLRPPIEEEGVQRPRQDTEGPSQVYRAEIPVPDSLVRLCEGPIGSLAAPWEMDAEGTVYEQRIQTDGPHDVIWRVSVDDSGEGYSTMFVQLADDDSIESRPHEHILGEYQMIRGEVGYFVRLVLPE